MMYISSQRPAHYPKTYSADPARSGHMMLYMLRTRMKFDIVVPKSRFEIPRVTYVGMRDTYPGSSELQNRYAVKNL